MKWPKSLILLALLFCLRGTCAAAGEVHSIDSVDRTLVLENSQSTAALRTAHSFIRFPDGKFYIYLEFTGLEAAENGPWVEVSAGTALGSAPLEPMGAYFSAWVPLELPAVPGSAYQLVSLDVKLYTQQGGSPLCDPVGFTVALEETIPFSLADAMACVEPAQASVLTEKVAVTLCLPPGTLEAGSLLRARLADQEGQIWGETETVALSEAAAADSRYGGVFQSNPYQVAVQALDMAFALAEPLSPGGYDVCILDEQDALLYRFENAVQCGGQLATEIIGWTEVPGAGERQASVTVFVANGAPNALQVALYQGERCLGVSEAAVILSHDPAGGGVLARYPILLEEPLEAGAGCTARLLDGDAFSGEAGLALEPVRQAAGTIYQATAAFDSACFANVLLETSGLLPGRQYRAALSQVNGQQELLLSELLVTPEESGMLDIEFLDDSGELIELEEGALYRVSLSQWAGQDRWSALGAVELPAAEGRQDMPEGDAAPAVAGKAQRINGVPVYSGAAVTNAADTAVEVRLYSGENATATPDEAFVLTASGAHGLVLDADDSHFAAQRYRADYWVESRPVGADGYGYWVTAAAMERYEASMLTGFPPFWNITLATPVNGSAMLYCGAEEASAGAWESAFGGFSEFYVRAIPDEGYVLDTILVNDRPITGRAFLLTEDSHIEVRFKPRAVEEFGVTTVCGTDSDALGGTLQSDGLTAPLGDTVTVTAAADAHYVLQTITCTETSSGGTVPLTAGPEPNTWTFVMPQCPVTVTALFSLQQKIQIGLLDYDTTAGAVSVPASAWQGEQMTVTAEPFQGCRLTGLWLVYGQETEIREDLLSRPGDLAGTYFFTVPAAETVWIAAQFAEIRYAITVDAGMQTGGSLSADQETARPGGQVTVTVSPDEQYQLTAGSLTAETDSGNRLTLTPGAQANTWLFTMPEEDVTLWAAFERRQIAGPGGMVDSAPALIAALGGDDAAAAEPGTGVVRLKNHVELAAPIVFTGGPLTLDLNDCVLTGAFSQSGMEQGLFVVDAGAAVTFCGAGPDNSGVILSPCHGVWVRGGAAVFAGGAQILSGTSGDGLYITGGRATVHGGHFSGVAALRLKGTGAASIAGGSFSAGGDGVILMEEGPASLAIRGGRINGGTGAALRLPAPLVNYLEAQVLACDPSTGAEYDDGWVGSAAPAGDVLFQKTQAALDRAGASTLRTTWEEVTLTLPVIHPTGDVSLVAAVYDSGGRLLGAQLAPCRRSAAEQKLTVAHSGTPVLARVFLVASDGLVPLAEPMEFPL